MTKAKAQGRAKRGRRQATADVVRELQSIESATITELNAAGIYDIGSYGWLNENDVDDEYVGHAMWQLQQPLAHALEDPFGERAVQVRPTERDKQVLVAGEDFCGMRLARMSIGLALLWRKHRPSHPLEDYPYFWLHHTDAVLKLSVAADRLREVMIVACTGGSVSAFERQGKKTTWYVAPFEQATALLEARGVMNPKAAGPIASLPKLAHQIYTYVARRNRIVHEVATRMAQLTRDETEALQKRYDREQKDGHIAFVPMREIPDYQDLADAQQAELDQAATAICDWYKTMIDASNNVFQVEYWSRLKS